MSGGHWYQRPIAPSLRRNRALRLLHAEVAAGKRSSLSSANGTTLLLLVERLEKAGVGYVLTAQPGTGYVVRAATARDFASTAVEEDGDQGD